MTETEKQTYETADGHAERSDGARQQIMLPPQLVDAIGALTEASKELRKGVRVKSDDAKQLKRWMANHQSEALIDLFLVLSQGFQETWSLAQEIGQDLMALRSFVLPRLRQLEQGALFDGALDEELVEPLRKALADLALHIAEHYPEDDKIDALVTRVGETLTALVEGGYDDDDGGGDEDEDDETDDEDEPTDETDGEPDDDGEEG